MQLDSHPKTALTTGASCGTICSATVLLVLALFCPSGLQGSPRPQGDSGAPLRVAVAGSEPFLIPNEAADPTGLSIDVWSAVARELGIEYEFVPADGVSDALDMVADGRADVIVGPISITAERSERVEFTQPYFSASLAILAPPSRSLLDGLTTFLMPALISGVSVLLGILLLVGVLLWLAERRANSEHFPVRPMKGIGNGIWAALVTLTTVGYGDVVPKSLAGRVVAGTWMILSVVVASSLTAFVATALTLSQINTGAISTAAGLSGRRVGTVAGTTSAEFATASGARLVPAADIESALSDLQAERTEALVFDRPILRYILEQNPTLALQLSEASYRPLGYGFAVRTDLPVRQRIGIALLRLTESGEAEAIAIKWLGP